MKAEQNLLPVLLTSICILKVYLNCSQTLLICGKTFIMPGLNPHVKEQSGLQFPGHCLEGELKPTGSVLLGDRGSLKVNLPPQNLTTLRSTGP